MIWLGRLMKGKGEGRRQDCEILYGGGYTLIPWWNINAVRACVGRLKKEDGGGGDMVVNYFLVRIWD